ncbi:uncharacterized protein CG5098 isoform X2 [Planococcus citri]|uniref:uncharacterized protein CG5098 isoform X2 n=1 Tax=Planococcus citri TaxID=170843 RepID=UPI0031F9E5B9
MSGGHYPPSYHHIQSPQEFISPRHRLPAIPPQGPTSAHAHSSLASCPSWTNKHNFSNYHENSSLYTQTTAKNYSPSTRSYYNEESGWSERNSHMNSSHRANSNDDKSRITYSNDVQQESMDLSSAAHVPSTGKTPTNDAATTVPVNGSPAAQSCDEKPSLNGSPDDKNTPEAASKTEPVSVIAANPLRETPSQDAESQVKAKLEAPALKSNDTAESTKPKHEQSITADRVESILETMFHSDTKSSTSTTSSSVTVNTPPCKTLDLRGESVEKILKSPSPVHGDHLESDLGLNSSEFESTRDSSTMNSLVTDVTVTNDTKPTKDDHDNSPKPSDDSNIEKLEKLVSNKQSDNQKIPTNSSKIENLGLVDDCDTPPVKSKSNTEPATDLSSVKTEPKEAPNSSSKKDTAVSAKKSDTNKEVPAKSKNRKEEITYVQVESELEKMFAGIEDISMDPVKSIQADDSSKRNPAPKTTNLSSHSAANDIQAKPVKKKSSKKSKSASTKKDAKKHSINSKDTSTDSVSFKRVPVIHVEGSKENPINVQIINSIKLEEDDISDAKTAAKRKQGKCDKANKRLAAAYSVKNYDPEASDDSWMCIFCKLSAHSPGLAGEPTGDLFGPYFIQTCSDSDSKRHSRKTDHLTEPIKKKKRSVSIESNHASTNLSEHNKSMEIWAHENCFIWASGIHLVGSKLVGLEAAVFEALQTICAHCGEKGASIGCRARHCKSFVHYSCALYTGWNLNPETFIAVCYLHKGTKTQ